MSRPNFSQKDLDHLATVIGEAESHTSGEIRVMIVSRSTSGGHVAPMLWLMLVTMGCIVVPIHWYWWLLPALMLAAAVITWPLSRWAHIQRALHTPRDRQHAVWARAELEFHREGLSHTRGGTGILLFLSLLERQAVVLADQGIARLCPEATWNDVVQKILEGARDGQWLPKLEAAIRLCGDHLSERLPATSHDENQLPNTVIIKE